MTSLAIADLKREPELQCRAGGVTKRTVQEYAASMADGAAFPPVTVFRDGRGVQWLADGFHRCAAAELAGRTEIEADVHEGGRKEALLHAVRANSEHGLRRTNADKRRAVLLVLGNFPKWTDRKIGEACGVDHKTVGAVRRSLDLSGEIPQAAHGASEGEQPTAAPPDLAPVYLRVLRAHASREPAEHVAAVVRAVIELHGQTTPAQLVMWAQDAATAPAPGLPPLTRFTPRRRIAQPPAASNRSD